MRRNLNVPAQFIHKKNGRSYALTGKILNINESLGTCSMSFMNGRVVENNIPLKNIYINEGFVDLVKKAKKGIQKVLTFVMRKIKGFVFPEIEGEVYPALNTPINMYIAQNNGQFVSAKGKNLSESMFFIPAADNMEMFESIDSTGNPADIEAAYTSTSVDNWQNNWEWVFKNSYAKEMASMHDDEDFDVNDADTSGDYINADRFDNVDERYIERNMHRVNRLHEVEDSRNINRYWKDYLETYVAKPGRTLNETNQIMRKKYAKILNESITYSSKDRLNESRLRRGRRGRRLLNESAEDQGSAIWSLYSQKEYHIKDVNTKELKLAILEAVINQTSAKDYFSQKSWQVAKEPPLLIWGAPGIGKTFIVKAVIKQIHEESISRNINILNLDCAGLSIDDLRLPKVVNNSSGVRVQSSVMAYWLPIFARKGDPVIDEAIDQQYNSSEYLNAICADTDNVTDEEKQKFFRTSLMDPETQDYIKQINQELNLSTPSKNDLDDDVNADPNQASMTRMQSKEATMARLRAMANKMKNSKPNYTGGIIFLDEFSRMNPGFANAIMKIVDEGDLDGFKLASRWGFICAANRPIDMLGSNEFRWEAAWATRFQQVNFVPTKSEWVDWGNEINKSTGESNVDPMILEFIDAMDDADWYDAVSLHTRPEAEKYSESTPTNLNDESDFEDIRTAMEQLSNKTSWNSRTWANISNAYRKTKAGIFNNVAWAADNWQSFFGADENGRRFYVCVHAIDDALAKGDTESVDQFKKMHPEFFAPGAKCPANGMEWSKLYDAFEAEKKAYEKSYWDKVYAATSAQCDPDGKLKDSPEEYMHNYLVEIILPRYIGANVKPYWDFKEYNDFKKWWTRKNTDSVWKAGHPSDPPAFKVIDNISNKDVWRNYPQVIWKSNQSLCYKLFNHLLQSYPGGTAGLIKDAMTPMKNPKTGKELLTTADYQELLSLPDSDFLAMYKKMCDKLTFEYYSSTETDGGGVKSETETIADKSDEEIIKKGNERAALGVTYLKNTHVYKYCCWTKSQQKTSRNNGIARLNPGNSTGDGEPMPFKGNIEAKWCAFVGSSDDPFCDHIAHYATYLAKISKQRGEATIAQQVFKTTSTYIQEALGGGKWTRFITGGKILDEKNELFACTKLRLIGHIVTLLTQKRWTDLVGQCKEIAQIVADANAAAANPDAQAVPAEPVQTAPAASVTAPATKTKGKKKSSFVIGQSSTPEFKEKNNFLSLYDDIVKADKSWTTTTIPDFIEFLNNKLYDDNTTLDQAIADYQNSLPGNQAMTFYTDLNNLMIEMNI